jgi:hypothetical protein
VSGVYIYVKVTFYNTESICLNHLCVCVHVWWWWLVYIVEKVVLVVVLVIN